MASERVNLELAQSAVKNIILYPIDHPAFKPSLVILNDLVKFANNKLNGAANATRKENSSD